MRIVGQARRRRTRGTARSTGFAALRTQLAADAATGTFCHGVARLADICLVPQLANARRVSCRSMRIRLSCASGRPRCPLSRRRHRRGNRMRSEDKVPFRRFVERE
jgi:glutathione S-transferase